MDEIGLFPLGLVLLPSEHVPLHIFEPRYRELIGECLEGGGEFGLVFADDDGMREIGTLAAVAEVVTRFPDGRLNVVVEGGARFRLVELTSGRSYQTGLVEPVTDRDDPAPEEAVDRALAVFRRVVALAGSEAEPPDARHPELSFALAGRFELAPSLKQSLLRRTSERERLETVTGLLERAAASAERQREVQELARGNGHVRPQS
jgi:ATP-dependent Lon protease